MNDLLQRCDALEREVADLAGENRHLMETNAQLREAVEAFHADPEPEAANLTAVVAELERRLDGLNGSVEQLWAAVNEEK